MITEKQRIEWLLELQEHPEQLDDQQLRQVLADEEMRRLVGHLGFAKRAFMNQEPQTEAPSVDAEWEKFAAKHLKKEEQKPELQSLHSYILTFLHSYRKIAASLIGIFMVSAIAYAAIRMVHLSAGEGFPSAIQEARTTDAPESVVATDTIVTCPTLAEPRVFSNSPLDTMLTEIANAHQVSVEFENDATRRLRFHFVWKREDSLERVVEKLNTFDAVNIVVENKKLIVR